jgi:hypothetical protein
MPNEVYNYVRIITGDEELINLFTNNPFIPETFFQPPQPNGQEFMEWRRNLFGTDRFFSNDGSRTPSLKYVNGQINGFFQTAWTPPIGLYEALHEKYPDIRIYYEYNDYYMGFCGYGSVPGQLTRFDWTRPDELITIKQSHSWHMVPWDPHFDYQASMAASQASQAST